MRILTVNAGSTSLRVVDVDDGHATSRHASLDEALAGPPPDGVAHRVVHGGDRTRAELVDDRGLESLRALAELAPLHQPPALDAIEQCRDAWPHVPNVVCFDTAFHTTIPEAARTYAIPARFRDTVRVYGFHGLSHAWAVGRVLELAPGARRVVVAHLGGGQSLCAALDGRSVMTTMGFTPLDGLVMATRSGALDPGAVLWLVRHTDEDIETVLESGSGLLGLCGDSDLRAIHARMAAGDAEARLAFDVWHHRIVTQLGACVAALGGLDALVFTGAIGEHDQIVRSAVADSLAWLGVAIADHRPATEGQDRELTAPQASVRSFAVTAREDLQIFAEAHTLLSSGPPRNRPGRPPRR
jgi:acetate kinase